MDGLIDGWMGWMDGWMDGWMVGWMVGWMDGWMDGRMDGWMYQFISLKLFLERGTKIAAMDDRYAWNSLSLSTKDQLSKVSVFTLSINLLAIPKRTWIGRHSYKLLYTRFDRAELDLLSPLCTFDNPAK